jgi:general secretion pathway protein H
LNALANDSGLTLIEVLVALGIVSFLITVSLPAIHTGTAELELATHQAETALRRAQSTAVRTHRSVEIAIDAAAGRIGSERIAPPTKLSVQTTADQKVSASAGTIRFFPDGGASGGGIRLAQGEKQTQILVDWLTGRVSREK